MDKKYYEVCAARLKAHLSAAVLSLDSRKESYFNDLCLVTKAYEALLNSDLGMKVDTQYDKELNQATDDAADEDNDSDDLGFFEGDSWKNN